MRLQAAADQSGDRSPHSKRVDRLIRLSLSLRCKTAAMPSDQNMESLIAWLPELIFTGGKFESGLALLCDSSGIIVRLARADELKDEKKINLPNRALLPGMINSHSHAFQRMLRGRTEYRTNSTIGR